MPNYPAPFGAGTLGNLQAQYPPPTTNTTTPVVNTGNTVCPGTSGPSSAAAFLVGVTNLSATAGTCTYTVYDNATTNAGQVVTTITNIGAAQTIIFPGAGIPLANGCCVNASGAQSPGAEFITR